MTALTGLDANQLAECLTGRPYISWSAISTYRTCPWKHYFRYIAGLPEESLSASLVFGQCLHAALENHFRAILLGEPPPDLNRLMDAYRDGWQGLDLQRVQFGKDESGESLASKAEKMLAVFQASDAAHPAGSIVGIEEELRGPIADGMPDLLARVDLLVDIGSCLRLTDFKTARARWSREQAEEEAAEQLLLYHALASRLSDLPVELEFVVLTKTKEPTAEKFAVPAEPARVERTRRVAQRVWQAIAAGHVYPAPSPMACGSCGYRQACRQWGG
jgi:CRISPR/Cas system-associated exonuclease Cas4 (RecB family)